MYRKHSKAVSEEDASCQSSASPPNYWWTLLFMRCMLRQIISTTNWQALERLWTKTSGQVSEGISRPDPWRWTDTLNVDNTLYWVGVGFPVLNKRENEDSGLAHYFLCFLAVDTTWPTISSSCCWDGPDPQLWAKIKPSFRDCSYPGLCHNQESNTHVLFLSTSDLLRMCTGSVMTQDRKEGSRARWQFIG